MNVRLSTFFLISILFGPLPSLGQEQPAQQSHLPQPPTAMLNHGGLPEELLRLQTDLSQVALDMDTIDARMMVGITNKTLSETFQMISKVHELLRGHSTGQAIKDSSGSIRNDIRWESCLKAAKLYEGLLEQVLEMRIERKPGVEKTLRTSPIADESLGAVQLVFLTRMMADLELRYSEIQSVGVTNPNVKQQELWRRLRQALQNDDRTYLKKLNALLVTTGKPPHQFAAEVISDAQKVSPTAAAAVVEGMGIVNLDGDIWRLAEIPDINPEFIRALDCGRRAMKEVLASGSNAAFVQLCSCRKYADGSYILAFTAKPADRSKSADLVGKAQFNVDGMPRDTDTLSLPQGGLTRGSLNPEQGDTKARAENRQGASKSTTFGVTYTAAPHPKIPSWWIRCECPDDHPDAGMVVDGVRWHAPVLRCPNPELRRLELNGQK